MLGTIIRATRDRMLAVPARVRPFVGAEATDRVDAEIHAGLVELSTPGGIMDRAFERTFGIAPTRPAPTPSRLSPRGPQSPSMFEATPELRTALWTDLVAGVRAGLTGTPLPQGARGFVPLVEAQRQTRRIEGLVRRFLSRRIPELSTERVVGPKTTP